jgi:hypothetical protein
MRNLLTIVFAATVAAATVTAQSSGGQQQKPPPKTDQKAAPSIAGKWTLTTVTQNGPLVSTMDLKLDGTKVSGTISSQMGDAAIGGDYADGRLTFSITMQTNNGAIDIAFSGALKDNGTLAGTLSYGGGSALEWTAERVKGSETPETQAAPAQGKPAPQTAAVTGKWATTLDISGVGPATVTLEFKQDGEKITGTYTGRYGTFPFQGTLKGRALTFTFTMNADGADVSMNFAGEVAEDNVSMRGTASIVGLGEATWTARKEK